MSFPRNKRNNSTSTPIDTFGESLSIIANATVNVEDSLTNAATLLNIPSRTLSMMLLSTDPTQIQCVTLIRNLSESLKEYPDGVLPEQLSQYIIHLNQHMQDNPVSEDGIPSFFELICPTVSQPVIINYVPFTNPNDDDDENDIWTDVNTVEDNDEDNDDIWDDNWNDDDHNYNVDEEQLHEPIILIPVSEQNIKEDLCVICFINLNQEPDVVETICKHQYHSNCINRWLHVKRCCPLCNGNL
jgi:hypothetical protein